MFSDTELPALHSSVLVCVLHGLCISLPRVKWDFYDSFHAKQTEGEAFICLHGLVLDNKFRILVSVFCK